MANCFTNNIAAMYTGKEIQRKIYSEAVPNKQDIRCYFCSNLFIMRVVGIGTRVLGFLLDFIIVCAITYGIDRGWDFYVFYYHIFYIPIYYFLAMVGFVYYLFFEAIWKRTPGKWLSLTKVVNQQGGKPTFFQIFIRSVVRVLGVIVIDSIFVSFLNKTLHDYVSRTEVIEI